MGSLYRPKLKLTTFDGRHLRRAHRHVEAPPKPPLPRATLAAAREWWVTALIAPDVTMLAASIPTTQGAPR
jgi:hypothetical protein